MMMMNITTTTRTAVSGIRRAAARSNQKSLLLVLLFLLFIACSLGSTPNNDDTSAKTTSSGAPDTPTCVETSPGECANPDNNQDGYAAPNLSDAERVQEFHVFLSHMFETVDSYAATTQTPNLQEQEQLILTTWLTYLKMDPSIITTPIMTLESDDALSASRSSGNWLYDIYKRTHDDLAPAVFFKIWDERGRPAKEEIRLLLKLDDYAYHEALTTTTDPETGEIVEDLDESIFMKHLFLPFRHRGFTAQILDSFCRGLLGPLKTISYAIPSPSNLEVISQYAPLIEVGAGSGYWSAALQHQYGRETITPYDAHPPESSNDDDKEKDPKGSLYFDRTYTQVHKGDCQSLFRGEEKDNFNNHTLLMVWPNNPDNVDNAEEFHSPRLPPVWDANCARDFVANGGTHIILVAERETNIHILPSRPEQGSPTWPDSGLCASRELQTLLQEEFELVHQMAIPTWYYSDDLTIWKRK